MFLERVARHYQAAGWAVQVAPPPLAGVRPDLVIRKGGREKAVLAFEEPPGPFRIAEFGAACRKSKRGGIVVCPDDARVADLCDQAGLEFVAGESMGQTVVLGQASPPPPIVAAVPAAPPKVAPAPATPPTGHPPLWQRRWFRWSVVATIWAAAVAVLAWDIRRFFSP